MNNINFYLNKYTQIIDLFLIKPNLKRRHVLHKFRHKIDSLLNPSHPIRALLEILLEH